MSTHQQQCEAAIVAGAWDTLIAESLAWSRDPDGAKDPRPLFARNVVYLIQGRFADAWKTHALCLEAQEHIAAVGGWVKGLLERPRRRPVSIREMDQVIRQRARRLR